MERSARRLPIRPRRRAARAASRLFAVLFGAALAGCATSSAPVSTWGDLRSQGAERLTGDALKALVVDSRLTTYDASGNDRVWNNDADGWFVATARRTGLASPSGRGTWRFGPGDTYCVSIAWQSGTTSWPESWCARVYRLGERHFAVRGGAGEPDEGTRAHPVSFRRLFRSAPTSD